MDKRQIENIESPGAIDKILGLSKAKTERGWLKGRIQVFKNRKNWEMAHIFESFLKVHNKFHPELKATVDVFGWKGKDKIKFIEKPDSFDIITHQRLHQDVEPKESKRNIHKNQINNVIDAINQSKGKKDKETNGLYYETNEIARNYCIIANIRKNKKGNELFPNGLFEWQHFFGDRRLHTDLNLILRLLNNRLVIHYRAGRTKILKKTFKFQTSFKTFK